MADQPLRYFEPFGVGGGDKDSLLIKSSICFLRNRLLKCSQYGKSKKIAFCFSSGVFS